MSDTPRPVALALFSGGLDSQLAACLVKQQGVVVWGIHFLSVFWEGRESNVRESAAEIDLELIERDVSVEMIELVKDPPHGHGKRMNPCLDCKILMLTQARRVMQERGWQFLVTGEVVGQRPMSQRRDCLALLEKAAHVQGLVVRPLSGRLLPATLAEEQGWIGRDELLAVSGRSRRVQLETAKRLGLTRHGTPAGGCSLTDPGFSGRLRDLLDHEGARAVADVRLLRSGRHFRLTAGCKLVVGRNREDNERLERSVTSGDLRLEAPGVPSPVALLRGRPGAQELNTAMRIVARYADNAGGSVIVAAGLPDGTEAARKVVDALPDDEVAKLRI
jgi:tRNA-specific 2-thiouridylase